MLKNSNGRGAGAFMFGRKLQGRKIDSSWSFEEPLSGYIITFRSRLLHKDCLQTLHLQLWCYTFLKTGLRSVGKSG